MKDLILEGRELLEKFMSKVLKEEDDEEQQQQTTSQSTNLSVTLDNDKATVVIARNYNGVRELLDDTKWNLLFTNTAFTRYQKQKYTMYFITLKKESPNFNNNAIKKMAVIISPSGEYTCYDATGSLIDINNVIKNTGIQRNAFKQIR